MDEDFTCIVRRAGDRFPGSYQHQCAIGVTCLRPRCPKLYIPYQYGQYRITINDTWIISQQILQSWMVVSHCTCTHVLISDLYRNVEAGTEWVPLDIAIHKFPAFYPTLRRGRNSNRHHSTSLRTYLLSSNITSIARVLSIFLKERYIYFHPKPLLPYL
jgi:hypothetical protein